MSRMVSRCDFCSRLLAYQQVYRNCVFFRLPMAERILGLLVALSYP